MPREHRPDGHQPELWPEPALRLRASLRSVFFGGDQARVPEPTSDLKLAAVACAPIGGDVVPKLLNALLPAGPSAFLAWAELRPPPPALDFLALGFSPPPGSSKLPAACALFAVSVIAETASAARLIPICRAMRTPPSEYR